MSSPPKTLRHNNSNQRRDNKRYINTIDKYGWNSILKATNRENVYAVLELLSDKMTDINSKHTNGWTPLFLAVHR